MKHSLVAWRITPQGHTYRDLTEQERKVSGGRNRRDRTGLIFRCSNAECRHEVYVAHGRAQQLINGSAGAVCCDRNCHNAFRNQRWQLRFSDALEGKEPWSQSLVERYVWQRDAGVCQVCGRSDDSVSYETGHKVDEFLGGPHTPENLAVMCYPCNRLKPWHDTLQGFEEWAAHKRTLRPRLLDLGLTGAQADAAIGIFREMTSPRYILRTTIE